MNESKINTKINEILKEFNAIEQNISENSSNNFEQNKSIYEKYSELKKLQIYQTNIKNISLKSRIWKL